MVNQSKCIACGACVEICPVNAISFDETGREEILLRNCVFPE